MTSALRGRLREGSEVVALPPTDAVVAGEGGDRLQMEKEVRGHVLDEVVVTGHRPAFPARLGDRLRRRRGEVLLAEPGEVRDRRLHASAELFDRPFIVGVRRSLATGQA